MNTLGIKPNQAEQSATLVDQDPGGVYERIEDLSRQAQAIIRLIKTMYLDTTDGAVDLNEVFYAIHAVKVIFEVMRCENKTDGLRCKKLAGGVAVVNLIDRIAGLAIDRCESFADFIAEEPISIGQFISSLDFIMQEIEEIRAIPYHQFKKME